MLSLFSPIEQISGIGPILQRKLKRLGVKTVHDLLFHLPHRYEDFSNLAPLSEIKINEICTVQGKILSIKNIKTWKRRLVLTEAMVEDGTGAIKIIWFNQPYLIKTLKPEDNAFFSGKVVSGKNGIYISNPVYEKTGNLGQIHTGRLVAIYPETAGLSSRWIRAILANLLSSLRSRIPETLPLKIIKENNFPPIEKALWQIHFPESLEEAEIAKKRFAFEELFLIQLFVLRERLRISREKAIPVPINLPAVKKFVNGLSFQLTDAQKKSGWRILKDLEKPQPMNRLLEGDVGSGKTVVAAMATLGIAKAGFQTAFMAPTEILSKQHFQEISRLFSNFNFNIGLLTGKQDQFRSKKLKNEVIEISRKKLLEKALRGDIDILIGTHALIQDKVKFGKLGLVIVDEQHRFGVNQRARLCKSATDRSGQPIIPHLLSMTATPIPRTLALTIYGDLDLSLIDQLPKGRKKIITQIINPEERRQAYEFIKNQVKEGRQIFVICPRIEAGNKDGAKKDIMGWAEAKAVKEEYEKLSKEIFPDLKLAMLHGKMTPKEKEQIMRDFKNKKSDILVSTSVVEVGVDVPNASVMMIEGADRFGLAQLHQFRGRVGRGDYQSYCFLFTESPSLKTRQRLKALVNCNDGFALAEKDLEIRGPGDFTGTRQWGIPDLMMGALKDIKLVEKTREAAKEILMQDPELKKFPLLREKISRFRTRIHME